MIAGRLTVNNPKGRPKSQALMPGDLLIYPDGRCERIESNPLVDGCPGVMLSRDKKLDIRDRCFTKKEVNKWIQNGVCSVEGRY